MHGTDDSAPETADAADPDSEVSDAALNSSEPPNSDRCDYCRLPIPTDPVTLERGGTVYEFCTEACRDAMAESDRACTEYHGFRRVRTGVSGLDRFLPQGFPRNSFVLLSNDEGARDDALRAELVWRALERDEPATVVTFTEPPVSVVEGFLSLDWNVLPYLESGQLHVMDCFTYRMDDRDRERMFERMDEWNRHIYGVTKSVTQTVRDPSDVTELHNKLDNCLEALSMSDRGIVVVDSLTEFGTLVQPVQAYNFVKDVRADVCKGRFVPVFAGGTFTGEEESFPHDLGYAVDGIVDMQVTGSIVKDTLIKRIRIRKMNGVLAIPEWVAYEFTAGKGLVTFDPIAEMDETDERVEGGDTPGDERGRTEDESDAENPEVAETGGE
ncbi:ATPase domain-containing protein [Halorussus sp. MSC15.2]|uniref:ATPase domain-containing protein n=1 Tax=Halorussus sp. MSC15.2 TaxID=2283638 RepID=UPI0013D31748|nr:ATPase domain-containing protein [Halorussus sp. MSC15.2]NEU59120.1 recombinase RecA [Halorussus sp. MSC15.2]